MKAQFKKKLNLEWKRKNYSSERFKDFEDISKYFKDIDSELIDAILFLAEEIQITNESLERLDNEYRGYDP